MRLFIKTLSLLILVTGLGSVSSARAYDLAKGLMYAVPAPSGQTPALNGSDTGWDLSGAEPVWMSTQLAKQLHGTLALNYDDHNLYVYVKASLPARKMVNPNGPDGPFWAGDGVEFRLCSDPSLGYPLSNQNPVMHTSRQVCHLTMWKDTNDGKDYLSIQYGGMNGGEQGKALNPPGSKLVMTESENQYVIQAVLPWSALHVPDGKNPFKPGSRMTAIFGLHWLAPGQPYSINAIYASDPGESAYINWGTWGQVEFSPTGNLKPHHGTMEEALAAATTASVGVPITVDVPEDGKFSLNIVGENGEVIRDVIGGQPVKAGKYTTYWDGRDQWGFAQPPGNYHWAAYFSHGLKVRLVGFVGSSGNPPYPTKDGKGGWGGDGGAPTGVAADDSGIYLGWVGGRTQAQIVKIDYAGNTLWRQSPDQQLQGRAGQLRALTFNGRYLFAVYSGASYNGYLPGTMPGQNLVTCRVHSLLVRLNPETGLIDRFGGQDGGQDGMGGTVHFGPYMAGGRTVLVPATGNLPAMAQWTADPSVTAIVPPAGSLPVEGIGGFGAMNGHWDVFQAVNGTEPDSIGVAATAHEVFASIYSQNVIQVIDAESGQPTRTLACPRPRGVALDAQGNLYAVSFGTDAPAQVVRFNGGQGTATPVVTSGLVAPVGLTVYASGQISVTDEGASQQIKTFSPDGKLVRTLGKEGGRPWAGAYDPAGFRDPFQIVADKQGGLVVSEMSIPKIFDRIDAASGKTLRRWFGWPATNVVNIPDADDPMTNYYQIQQGEGFARATAPGDGTSDYNGQTGLPDAYWAPLRAGMEGVGQMFYFGYDCPYVNVLANGKKYFIEDKDPHAVCLIDGDNFLPVGNIDASRSSVWIDKNGDHKQSVDEVTPLAPVGGKPLPYGAVMWLDEKGNAYLMPGVNSILKIPSDGFADNGAILWNPNKASYVLPAVMPSLLNSGGGGRAMPGLRTDSQGNIYVCLSATVPALTPDLAQKIQATFPNVPQSAWFAYATPELAAEKKKGLGGRMDESNIAKFAKFSPDGKLIWTAGRKATAAASPGEMYPFWNIAGMVGDDYVASSSECGPIYFYTSDGFYVEALMNDPATQPPAGPYTFGIPYGNQSGQVRAFPKLGKVFAYDQGGIYAVDGFDSNLKVSGEHRFQGTVVLDKVY